MADLGQDDEDEDASPWAAGSLMGDAFGTACYVAIQWRRAAETADFMAQLTQQHGLVF